MIDPSHSIRAQRFDVEVASEALAVALQPRISDLNRRRLLPVIERVLGELDVPGRHLRVDRLMVDLGELPLAGLEEMAEAALYDALHRSLRAAIDGEGFAGGGPSAESGPITLLAHYLRYGTLPFWAPSVGTARGGFSADGLVQDLAAKEPVALVALIRRIGRDPHVLERLVLQVDETTLQNVLRLIEPAHAALIITYLLDLRHIHRAEPMVSLGEAAFVRLLWVLALSYLVRDAGTQFNRKSFVSAILEGMARSEGLDYRTLVATLTRGLRTTMRHLPLSSSLPAVIAEIAHDFDGMGAAGGVESVVSPDPVAPAESLADADAVGDMVPDEPTTLVILIRRYGSDRQALARLVSRLDETTLQAVLQLLEPVHAALIIAYFLELRQVHRVAPMLALGETEFARLLWVLTLSYLVRDAGSQFNRRSFVRALLEGLARSEGLDYGALVATLARGLQAIAARRPLASSLPAVIDEIVRDIGPIGVSTGAEPLHPGGELADSDPATLAALIRRYANDQGTLDRLVSRLDDSILEAVLRLLEPVHAALVISYLLDLRRIHRAAALPPQSDASFRRLLWVLTLSYFARDAGSQFNRKSFVRALLSGMALSEGLDYDAVLTVLADGLRVTAGRQPNVSSLPAVIDELSREAPPKAIAVAGGSAAIVDRYIRLDALGHYLRHGVLPIDVLLHRPDLTVETLLADLPGLGMAQLRALLSGVSADARWQALLRAVRGLPADVLATLAQGLLPRESGPESPLQAAFAAAVAAARYHDVFHARFIAALLAGEDLDLEAMVAAAAQPASPPDLPDDPGTWPAPSLVAALLAGLRTKAASGGEPDWERRLDALLTRYPAEGKSFFYAVGASSERDAMLARIPPRLYGRVLALARPAEAQAIEVLLSAIGALPISERPGSDAALRHAVLAGVLRIGTRPGSGKSLLDRLLREVFGGRPTASVADQLSKTFAHAALPEASRALLTGALSAVREESTAADAEMPFATLREALFDWLRGTESERAEALPLEALLSALPAIVAVFPDEIRAFLIENVGRPDLRERWAGRLPEAALAHLIHVLEPQHFRAFIDSAELLYAAAAEATSFRQVPSPPRTAMWETLLGYLGATPAPERSTEGLLAGMVARAGEDGDVLRQAATHLARTAGRQGLVAALMRSRPTNRPRAPAQEQEQKLRESPRERRARGKTAFSLGEPEEPDSNPIYIDNAGLALAGPFLPHLFRSLDLLAQDETGATRMRDHDAASRAVHLLQYLADGRCSAPEPLLVLNKIMCGVPSGAPILREIVPSDRERELCDSLLNAMIARWEIIKNSSIAALRETFLQREGRLARKGESWELRVDRKTVDVLVDRVPWSIALIYNNWMPQPLHVTW